MFRDLWAVLLGRQTEGQLQVQAAFNEQHLTLTKHIHELREDVTFARARVNRLKLCNLDLVAKLHDTQELLADRRGKVADLKRILKERVETPKDPTDG